MIEITADKFGGNYYLEASTLFRRESDGVDMPAEFIIPNCKVQSNFTFSLAATGDPSTFTFTMDAFPDYTKFDQTHKVLAAIQVISDESGQTEGVREPCEEKLSTYSDKVEVEFIKNGRTAAEVEATGTCDSKDYEESVFGSDIAKGSEVIINFPVEPEERSIYTIIQTNPGLINFSGNGVEGTVKTKTYTGKDLEEGYGLLLTEESTQTTDNLDEAKNITVEITGGNNFHKIYTIKNFVDFNSTTSGDGGPSAATTYSTRSYKPTLADED